MRGLVQHDSKVACMLDQAAGVGMYEGATGIIKEPILGWQVGMLA